MSRANMISDAPPKHVTQSGSSQFPGDFSQFFKRVGNGAIVEGTVIQLRKHSVKDKARADKPYRYLVIVLEVTYARRRNFDKDGKEIEPEHSRARREQKGWLNHFDHYKAKELAVLSPDELAGVLSGGNAAGPLPPGWNDDGLSSLHPKSPGVFEFWGTHKLLDGADLVVGDEVRFKTKGNSPFVDKFAKLSDRNARLAPNYGGEDVGTSWTARIMAKQGHGAQEKDEEPLRDESEWDP